MKLKQLVMCILIILVLPVPVMSFPLVSVEGALGVAWNIPSGELQANGDTLDLEDDFSLSRKTDLFGRLKINMPRAIPNAYLVVNPVKFTETTTQSFEFGGAPFSGDLDTELKLNQYDLGLYYPLPFLRTATVNRFNLDAGLNFRYIDAEASVSDQGEGRSESESMKIIIPQVYLGAQFQPTERYSIEAEVKGLTYRSDSSYSLLGRVKAKAFGPVFVSGGYRYDTYDIDKSGFMVDFNMSGPFVETGFSL
jgi:outer membrane protein